MAKNTPRNITAIEKARVRRAKSAGLASSRTRWFIEEVSNKVSLTMKVRVRLATEFLKSVVVKNISRPVTKIITSGRVRVTNRSKPGEFPKADTTHLMKTIFGITKETHKDVYDGFIGTPVDYGVKLELKMKRSFLRRSMNEQRSKIIRLLSGPIK